VQLGLVAQTHWHHVFRPDREIDNEIEKHPSIYDKSLSEYNDVDKKEDILSKIAGKLSIGSTCK
jgi:hypothetical protein